MDSTPGASIVVSLCLYEQRNAVAGALATLTTDLSPLTAIEYKATVQCVRILSPFQAATVELSQEQKVSGSKIISLNRMLKHSEMINQTRSYMEKLGLNLLDTH